MPRCGYCNSEYDEAGNHDTACRHHPQFFFPYDIDKDGIHQKGWQCCGSEEPRAPGCVATLHRDDVRQVYRPNSIAYDYVVVDELAERRAALERERRAERRERMSEKPELTATVTELEALIGRPVAQLLALVGEPEHDDAITNGVSGMVSVCHRLFFEYRDVHWQVDTNYRRTPGGPVGSFEVASVGWFVDRDERDEHRARMVTDLTGD